ncbi:hypothetical protein AGMMS49975_26300 [Clostridia bacterium]|nr:hypothetical protein AGMMS49975_26300 [Clostridia bacterium]
MLIKPIPRAMLIHSVTLKHVAYKDINQNETYEEQRLYRVRFMQKRELRTYRGDYNEEVMSKGKLFIDRVFSTQPTAIALDDIIVFEGAEYVIKAIDSVCGLRAHHMEITF